MSYKIGDKETFTYQGNGKWGKGNSSGGGEGGGIILILALVVLLVGIYLAPLIALIIIALSRSRQINNTLVIISVFISSFYGLFLSYNLLTEGALYEFLHDMELSTSVESFVITSSVVSTAFGLFYFGSYVGLYSIDNIGKRSTLSPSQLERMTKGQIIKLAKEQYNLDLDPSELKRNLISIILAHSQKS